MKKASNFHLHLLQIIVRKFWVVGNIWNILVWQINSYGQDKWMSVRELQKSKVS